MFDKIEALLKRLSDYGWYFVCGLASNRHFKGQKITNYKTATNWYSKGKISTTSRHFVRSFLFSFCSDLSS